MEKRAILRSSKEDKQTMETGHNLSSESKFRLSLQTVLAIIGVLCLVALIYIFRSNLVEAFWGAFGAVANFSIDWNHLPVPLIPSWLAPIILIGLAVLGLAWFVLMYMDNNKSDVITDRKNLTRARVRLAHNKRRLVIWTFVVGYHLFFGKMLFDQREWIQSHSSTTTFTIPTTDTNR